MTYRRRTIARLAPDLNFEHEPWMDRGLCAQFDGDTWYPEKGSSTRPAKTICRQCDVKTACLAYALEHNERWGVWGGLSETERRRVKRRRAA